MPFTSCQLTGVDNLPLKMFIIRLLSFLIVVLFITALVFLNILGLTFCLKREQPVQTNLEFLQFLFEIQLVILAVFLITVSVGFSIILRVYIRQRQEDQMFYHLLFKGKFLSGRCCMLLGLGFLHSFCNNNNNNNFC